KPPKRAPAASCRSFSGSWESSPVSLITSPESHVSSRCCGRFVPLCRKPERLAQPEPCRQRLHLRRGSYPDFPERRDRPTVLLPERFRAISPSAAANAALSRKPAGHCCPGRVVSSRCERRCHLLTAVIPISR